ncbi:MAG: hydrogenase maturation nickel metallochaperone HypA [Armatimonadota bacterium]|nr:MAG: hydrogenase maturation nickel metallochaperone HypA [Armatimonadota bacterium]
MHELSLAMQIQGTVLKAAAEHEVQDVVEVDIEIGELSLFNPDQVEFWLRQLFRDTVAEGADIRVATIPPKVKCDQCGYEGAIEVPSDPGFHIFMPALRCPRCDAPGLEVERGREVTIKNLRVHKAPPGGAHA